jgi:hypothetical protein
MPLPEACRYSILPNGTPPTDGTGIFKTPVPLLGVPGRQGESAIVSAALDGNGVPDIVAADPGNHSIDIWFNLAASPTFSNPISLPLPSGDDPIVVDKFTGASSNPDLAVLNSNGTLCCLRAQSVPWLSVLSTAMDERGLDPCEIAFEFLL